MSQNPTLVRGFALPLAVLTLLVFSMMLTITYAKFSLSTNVVAQTMMASTQALVYAESCTESVLTSLRGIPDLDDMRVTLPTGNECEVKVERDDDHFVIQSSSTVETATRQVTVNAIRGPNLVTVTSWLDE